MREDVRLAVVSPSRISPLARMYSQMARVQLSWLCTTQPQSIFAAQPGIAARTTSEFSNLIEDDQLDAVAFDLDIASRGDWPKQALLAEKHVFVAGPLAATSAELSELVAAAVGERSPLARLFCPLSAPGERRSYELSSPRGTLGEIHYLRGSVTRPVRFRGRPSAQRSPGRRGPYPRPARRPADRRLVARSEAYVNPYGEDTIDAQLRFATGYRRAHPPVARR